MTISVTKDDKTITIQTNKSSCENILDEFMFCLMALEFDAKEIKEEFDKISNILNDKE